MIGGFVAINADKCRNHPVADDPGRCAALGKKGRIFAAGKFNREALAMRMLAEMESVTDDPA